MTIKSSLLIITGLWIAGCGAATADDLSTLLAQRGKGDSIDLQLVCDLIYEVPVDCTNQCNLPPDFAQRLVARGVAPWEVPSFTQECSAPTRSAPWGSWCQTPDGACVVSPPQPFGSYCQCGGGLSTGSITG